jgi:3-oxoacyl-[acyl-carrier protein] reductase
MDLQIEGRTALVCASSHGLGKACALELARAGCRVVINGRDADDLAATSSLIRSETGAHVMEVAGDIGDPEVQAAMVSAAGGQVDILVNNNGGPPPRSWKDVDAAAIQAGVAANMATPIAMAQRVIDGMIARRWGRIVCITSGSIKAPLPGLDLSSGARIGLHGFLAGVAREVVKSGVTINFLLPGAFDTRRIEALNRQRAREAGTTLEAAGAERVAGIPAQRLGEPGELGAACAFLCSEQAGFITGQSLLIDGGAYPGVL